MSAPLGANAGLDPSAFSSALAYLRTWFIVQIMGPGFFEIGSMIMLAFLASITVRIFNWVRRLV